MTYGIIISVLLCACSKQVDSAQSNNSQDTYYNIRKSLAAHNIESAAQLTTDPQKAFAQWKAYSDRVGKDVFMQKMQNTVDQIKFHSIRDEDEYSMILIDLPDNPYSTVAAQFYIKTDAGQYLNLSIQHPIFHVLYCVIFTMLRAKRMQNLVVVSKVIENV